MVNFLEWRDRCLDRLASRPQAVFDAVTTPEGIAQWWGPDAGPVLVAETDPRIGGRFRVRFRKLDRSRSRRDRDRTGSEKRRNHVREHA
jgi:hypothetical protein